MTDNLKPVTLRDIAEKTGLSKSSVSRALQESDQQSEETKRMVRKVAKELGYEPSAAMSAAMRAARSRGEVPYRETLGVLLIQEDMDTSDPVNPKVSEETRQKDWFKGLQDGAAQNGFGLNYFCLGEVEIEKLKRSLQARGIQKLIVADMHMGRLRTLHMSQREYEELQSLFKTFSTVFILFGDVRIGPGIYVQADLFDIGRRSFIEGWKAGYRHFVITHVTQFLDTERRFESGVRFASGRIAEGVKIEYGVSGFSENPDRDAVFQKRLNELDASTCLIGSPSDHLYLFKRMKKPNPPAIISWHTRQLKDHYPWTGFDQDEYGQAMKAIQLCLSITNEQNRTDDPIFTLHSIETKWVEGKTLPRLRNNHLNLLPDKPYPPPKRRSGLPKREKHHFVDISSICNSRIGPYTPSLIAEVAAPPPGKWVFHEIPFSVEGEEEYPAMVLVGNPDKEAARELGISPHHQTKVRIGRKAVTVSFLHACFLTRQRLQPVAKYRFRFTDGTMKEISLLPYGPCGGNDSELKNIPHEVNIQDWYSAYGYINSRDARAIRMFNFQSIVKDCGYIYTLQWQNPTPSKIIKELEIVAGSEADAMLLLYAVTLDG